MQELIDAVEAWPVIVQGVLGSAVFWLLQFVGQRIFAFVANKYSTFSKKSRLSWLANEQAKCFASLADSHGNFATFATIILYRASRPLIKALMWFAMGFIAQRFFSELGVIGFIGGLYYLFKAYTVVAPMDASVYNDVRLRQLNAERNKLET